MKYEWDAQKSAINFAKHQVSFDEAVKVFDDPFFVDLYDSDHSVDEHRYLIIGQSRLGRVLIVSYAERGETIRIISARELTAGELEKYEEG